MQLTNYAIRAMLANVNKADGDPNDGILNNCKLRLVTAGPSLNARMEWADFTEATFTGYAMSAQLVWNTPITDSSDQSQILAQLLEFLSTGTAVGNTVVGYAITDETTPLTPKLVAADYFELPVPIAAPGDGLAIVPAFGIPNISTVNATVIT